MIIKSNWGQYMGKFKIASFIIIILLTNLVTAEAIFDLSGESENNVNLEILTNKVLQDYTNKPSAKSSIEFTENRGQLENDEVRFYVLGGSVWFTDDGVWFEVREEIETRDQGSQLRGQGGVIGLDFDPIGRFKESEPIKYKRVILKQEFVGANEVRPLGSERFCWNSNFFYGNNSSKWCTDVPNYAEVYYENIYDGIDLRYFSNDNGLKYDFIVNPGANVNQIRVKYEGADTLKIDGSRNLIIETPFGNIVESELFIYQNIKGSMQKITGAFKTFNETEYGFEILDNYCPQEVLIIDPKVDLEYSTYIGGASSDEGYGIAVDSTGNTYITGRTFSDDFPTTNGSYNESRTGSYDIFVTKLDLTGSNLVYSTYIGSSTLDCGIDIVVNSTGYAFVTGETLSQNFPTTIDRFSGDTNSGGFSVIIFQLSPNGSELKYSTYIGGTNNHDDVYSIAIDSNNNMYIAGHTSSYFFPTTSGAFDSTNNDYSDGFILKLNHSGNKLDYCTLLGDSERDYCHDIAIDNAGNAYITGYTRSPNFPCSTGANDTTFNGNNDCYIFKLNPTGTNMIYSTFLGGSEADIGYGIVIDSLENAYVTGSTKSADFPNTTSAFDKDYNDKYSNEDVFIAKIDQYGKNLIYSTYIGGEWGDIGYDIAIDMIGNVYVTGETDSQDFPITSDAYDNQLNGNDAFLLQLAMNGSTLLYSTYLGGTNYDYGLGITIDRLWNVYMTGYTYSNNFPTTEGAYNRSFGGNQDVFVTKFSFEPYICISSLCLLNNNNETSIIYSKLSPYTFRTNVIGSVGKSFLKDVILYLDPLGLNIQLIWNHSSGQFSKLSDPHNYISLDPSSNANNFLGLWTVDFNLTFNWNYPNEEFVNVNACASSVTFPSAWLNVSNMYYVENDLIFNGSLIVKRKDNKIINSNEIVKGGEQLSFTGLTVVYENTTEVYPPTTEINVTIIDDNGNNWTTSPFLGEPFYLELITPNVTHILNFIYNIKIIEIPNACDKSNIDFSIRIDSENVTFSKKIPKSNIWHTTNEVNVGVTITDTGGGVVNSSTVMYSISTNNGFSWKNWELVSNLESSEIVIPKDTVIFKEGKDNLIKWRACDSVGNGPTESQSTRILVDTKDVEFSNAWPLSSDVSQTEKVEVGITIFDETSGVNASTIEYSISNDIGKTWITWNKLERTNNNLTVNVQTNLTFINGTSNRLKWRAFDIAGNGPFESEIYVINVNTWQPPIIPKVVLNSPLNALKINETTVNLTWTLDDPKLDDVTYDLHFDDKNPPDPFKFEIENTTYMIENLKDGATYYWQIVSYVNRDERDSFKSEVWWFKVELPEPDVDKVFKIKLTGPESITMKPGTNKTISLSITNLGNTEDMIDVKIESSNISNYITLNDYSILKLSSNKQEMRTFNINLPIETKPGTYEITLTAISLKSEEEVKDNHTITLVVQRIDSGQQPDKSESNNLLLYGMIVIIILIIIIILFFIIFKSKKKKVEKLLPDKTITTKPIPTHIISIGETQKQPTLQQPTQTVSPSSILQQPHTTIASSPTLAQQQSIIQQPTLAPQPTISQTQVTPQIPRVVRAAETPQLPPAQNQENKSKI
jgi:hypothetical protein